MRKKDIKVNISRKKFISIIYDLQIGAHVTVKLGSYMNTSLAVK